MISSRYIDVFNGDADGIIALHQLRLAEPRPAAKLISGVKRDINLLGQVSSVQNCTVTVLDISLDSNRDALLRLLNNDCSVRYIDHHFSGAIPDSARLTVHIDPSPDICTSLIVDRLLNGRFRAWAIAAAFGDNLHDSAVQTAETIRLTDEEIKELRELGELLNYNSYGITLADLHFTPQQMYQAVHAYADPFDFIHNAAQLKILRRGIERDINLARELSPLRQSPGGRIYELPPESWSRRIVGVFSNELARREPDLAHALLIRNSDKSFRISVRAPINHKQGADSLCLQFPTGGGRKAAAGINALPPDQLHDFIETFETVFKNQRLRDSGQ